MPRRETGRRKVFETRMRAKRGPSMDIFQKCFEYDLDKKAMAKGIYPYFQPLDGLEGTEATCNGCKVIMIGSNNYLGLTMHPKVRAAALQALDEFGPSCTGSRFLNGTLALHEELEQVRKAADTAASLTRQLLAFARRQAPSRTSRRAAASGRRPRRLRTCRWCGRG